MGYVLRKRDDLKNSAVHYKKALEINPKHLGALEYQGELFLTMGNLDLAKANLDKSDKLCWLGCDEYDDLKASIEAYQQGKKSADIDRRIDSYQISLLRFFRSEM